MAAKTKRSRRPVLSDRARLVAKGLEELVTQDPVAQIYLSGRRLSQQSSARLSRRWRQLASKNEEDASLSDIFEMEGIAAVLIKRGLVRI